MKSAVAPSWGVDSKLPWESLLLQNTGLELPFPLFTVHLLVGLFLILSSRTSPD